VIEQLFRQHAQYEKMSVVDVYHHLLMPEMLGRLVHYNTPEGPIAFTWTRPTTGQSIEKLMSGTADMDLWADHHPDTGRTPWIVDVAGGPGVSGNEIGRFLRWAVVEEGIAYDGQKVLFHRSSGIKTGRIGFFTARGL